ncbi:MAG: hypothetical protein R3F13_01800 [Prosthecobacter sp.]
MVRLSTAGFMLSMLASCAMPPREAWNEIQSRGLLTYYMGAGHSAPLGASNNTQKIASTTTPAPTTTPTSTNVVVGPERPNTPPPSMLNAAKMPVAQVVPDLPGYVRTPFTNPPRLVDVRGMSAGSKVVCPYTQRPFLVPGGVRSTASNTASAASKPKKEVTPERPRTTPASPNTSVAANNVTPKTSTPPAPTTSAPVVELPYGSAIAGRPGFVNSPYAAKHQLVDVTGLPVGMEVKCPYTGKLFRVPPQ